MKGKYIAVVISVVFVGVFVWGFMQVGELTESIKAQTDSMNNLQAEIAEKSIMIEELRGELEEKAALVEELKVELAEFNDRAERIEVYVEDINEIVTEVKGAVNDVKGSVANLKDGAKQVMSEPAKLLEELDEKYIAGEWEAAKEVAAEINNKFEGYVQDIQAQEIIKNIEDKIKQGLKLP